VERSETDCAHYFNTTIPIFSTLKVSKDTLCAPAGHGTSQFWLRGAAAQTARTFINCCQASTAFIVIGFLLHPWFVAGVGTSTIDGIHTSTVCSSIL